MARAERNWANHWVQSHAWHTGSVGSLDEREEDIFIEGNGGQSALWCRGTTFSRSWIGRDWIWALWYTPSAIEGRLTAFPNMIGRRLEVKLRVLTGGFGSVQAIKGEARPVAFPVFFAEPVVQTARRSYLNARDSSPSYMRATRRRRTWRMRGSINASKFPIRTWGVSVRLILGAQCVLDLPEVYTGLVLAIKPSFFRGVRPFWNDLRPCLRDSVFKPSSSGNPSLPSFSPLPHLNRPNCSAIIHYYWNWWRYVNPPRSSPQAAWWSRPCVRCFRNRKNEVPKPCNTWRGWENPPSRHGLFGIIDWKGASNEFICRLMKYSASRLSISINM